MDKFWSRLFGNCVSDFLPFSGLQRYLGFLGMNSRVNKCFFVQKFVKTMD